MLKMDHTVPIIKASLQQPHQLSLPATSPRHQERQQPYDYVYTLKQVVEEEYHIYCNSRQIMECVWLFSIDRMHLYVIKSFD